MEFFLEIIFIYKVFILSVVIGNDLEDFTENEFDQCLGELEIKDLLRLKHSLDHMEPIQEYRDSLWNKDANNQKETKIESEKREEEEEKDEKPICKSQNCLKPLAMALTGQPRGYHVNTAYHQHHHHNHKKQHSPWIAEEKPSKLETIFRVSITALSFLSFGGYLLCLIVQAIKSKGTTYYHPILSTATPINSGVKRIKVYRRGRRAIQQTVHDSKTSKLHQLHFNYPYDIWLPRSLRKRN